MEEYKTIICIDGKSVEDILRLPCVMSCTKTSYSGIYIFAFYAAYMAHTIPYQRAYTGDTLCCDKEDKWHIFRKGKELL